MIQLEHSRGQMMYKLHSNHKYSKAGIDQQIGSQCNQYSDQ